MPVTESAAAGIVLRTLDAAIATHQRVRGLDLTAVTAAAAAMAAALGSGRKYWRSATVAAPGTRSTWSPSSSAGSSGNERGLPRWR